MAGILSPTGLRQLSGLRDLVWQRLGDSGRIDLVKSVWRNCAGAAEA